MTPKKSETKYVHEYFLHLRTVFTNTKTLTREEKLFTEVAFTYLVLESFRAGYQRDAELMKRVWKYLMSLAKVHQIAVKQNLSSSASLNFK